MVLPLINTMNKGFGIIEIIVALGIFVIIAVTGITTVVGTFSTNRLGSEETRANVYAQEGLNAGRSIRNQGWDTPFLGTDCSAGCGVTSTGGTWQWSGTDNSTDGFTRVIVVSDVQRDGSENIVESGGTDDPNTKKITSTVSWDFTPTRNNVVELVTYVTNWRSDVDFGTCPVYCQQLLGYVDGTCRATSAQCTSQSETYESGGDAYCTGGPSTDTCCCSGTAATPTPTPTGAPTPTPTAGPTPTPTSTPSTCTAYCSSNGFTSGVCRQNANQCTNNGETHSSGGDAFCTGGPSADTCCCQ